MDDIVGRSHDHLAIVTPAERERLYEHALLYVAVFERYPNL